MFTARGSVIVQRPIDEVFQFLTDVDRYPEWQHSAYTVHHETGGKNVRAGSRIRDNRNLLGKQMDHLYEISDVNPPHGFTIKTVSGPVPFTFRWQLEQVGDSTRIVGQGEGEWTDPNNEEQVAIAGERMLEGDLRTLKEVLEHEGRGKKP